MAGAALEGRYRRHPVQGRRASDHRAPRRGDRRHQDRHGEHRGAAQWRQGQGPRHPGHAAFEARAERADAAGSRARWLPAARVVGTLHAGGQPRRRAEAHQRRARQALPRAEDGGIPREPVRRGGGGIAGAVRGVHARRARTRRAGGQGLPHSEAMMRIIDLHCYPGTKEWIACQGPYVEALAKYWKREGAAKSEEDGLKDFTDAGVEACLVALDLETTIKTPPVTNEYVHAMWKRHPKRIIQCWGAVEPAKGEIVFSQVKKAVKELGFLGFHFHPIMQHFAVDDRRYYPMFEPIDELQAAVMIDVGTTGMGAGMPVGMGAIIRHAHPSSIDRLAADFPDLRIVMAHPGWPWV